MIIKPVSIDDAKELVGIYAPYVEKTAITFEYEVPSVKEFETRINTISKKYPYLKAVDDNGRILGYAYAGVFKGRKAYDWCVEATVYIKENCRKAGIGRSLYEALEKSLKEMGILNMNACITVPKIEDEYSTFDSYKFHEKMGFKLVGKFHDCGYKFGRWYDMVWMEKMLGAHKNEQPDVKFGEWK